MQLWGPAMHRLARLTPPARATRSQVGGAGLISNTESAKAKKEVQKKGDDTGAPPTPTPSCQQLSSLSSEHVLAYSCSMDYP